MCIIERKTYIHPDRSEFVETPKLCRRAVGTRPCNRVEYRDTGSVRITEKRPSKTRNSSDGLVVTEGFNGNRNVYRDVSNRSSSSSVRNSLVMSDGSPQPSLVSQPSSASSPSYVEVKPKAPTPPLAADGYPPLERLHLSSPPLLPQNHPTSPPDPRRIVTPEGTAIYERPPSLGLPRATENERPSPSMPTKKTSVSSMKAEVDNAGEASKSQQRPKRSITIDTSVRPATPSSSLGSPGLSSLPRVGNLRRDSGQESTRRDSKRPERRRTNDDRIRRQAEEEQRQRQAKEDEYQARLERERLAASDRRQREAREEENDASSRDRHRREAAEALEGRQRQRNDPFQADVDAEQEQMARERTAAAARRRESDVSAAAASPQRYADDYYLRQESDTRNRYYRDGRTSPTATRTGVRFSSDSYTYPTPTSPQSTRSSLRPVAIHHQQQQTSSNRSSTISERGQRVLARERESRAATQRLSSALGGSRRVEDRYEEYYDEDEDDDVDEEGGRANDYYYVGGDRRRRQGQGERYK